MDSLINRPYVKIVFKNNKEILTDVSIDIIDNNLISIGFIKVEDIENNINYIITRDSIYLIYEIN